MLDKFVASSLGAEVTARCASTFLGRLPPQTRLVVMFGLGSKLGYVDTAEKVVRLARTARG